MMNKTFKQVHLLQFNRHNNLKREKKSYSSHVVQCEHEQCTDRGSDRNDFISGRRRRGRDVEYDELIADELAVHSHSEAYACLPTCVRCLEVQTDSDLVAARLSRPLVTTHWATKLT